MILKTNMTWLREAKLKTGFDWATSTNARPTVTDVWGVFAFDGKPTKRRLRRLAAGPMRTIFGSKTVAFNDNNRKVLEAYVDDSWKYPES